MIRKPLAQRLALSTLLLVPVLSGCESDPLLRAPPAPVVERPPAEEPQPTPMPPPEQPPPEQPPPEQPPPEQPPPEPPMQCVTTETAFDIEEVSTLEDAFGLPEVHDAIVLDRGLTLAAGETWRVVAVEVLAMMPDWMYDFYADDLDLEVEVFPGASPVGVRPWTLRQRLRKGDLSWQRVHLANPATASDPDQRRAWWRFDLSGVIPESGMLGEQYMVGVHWLGDGEPLVGYSNYNRACRRNWTDGGFGFHLNGDNHPAGQDEVCSWPMFRVVVEKRSSGLTECP